MSTTATPTPRWQKITALSVAVVDLILVIAFRSRLSADFWPPDNARIAPNIVASIVQAQVVLIAAALLWPPLRRAIHQAITAHLAPLHDSHIELHAKLDHIIHHHPDIPTFPAQRAETERTP